MNDDFKILAKEIKKRKLSVGGTFKDDSIIIQGITEIKTWKYLKLKKDSVKR
jgi:translation initiation factor 1